MAHKPMVNGAVYEMDKGKSLVNGTVYEIDKGKTLIGGTAYGVDFMPSEVTLAIVNNGDYVRSSVYTVSIDGVEHYYGETLVVPYGTVVYLESMDDEKKKGPAIYLNGSLVSTNRDGTTSSVKTEARYWYTATKNATIEIRGGSYNYLGDDVDYSKIYITET